MKKGMKIGIGIAAAVLLASGVALVTVRPWEEKKESGGDTKVRESLGTDFVVSYDGIKTAAIQAGGCVHDPSIIEADGPYYI